MIQTIFKMDSWEEKPYFEADDQSKLSAVSVVKSYSGEINGKGILNYLMSYYPDGSAYFVGIERVEGNISGKSGTFVFSHKGTFKEGLASSKFHVVKESATGGLAGLTGKGSFSSGHSTTVTIEFLYQFS